MRRSFTGTVSRSTHDGEKRGFVTQLGGGKRGGRRGNAHLSVLMIDHNVMRFHIAVHDALAVTVVKCLEELVDVIPNIEVVEFWVETPKVGIVHVFED